MAKTHGGKGDRPRPIDRKGWEESKLWENMKKVAELKNCTGDPDEVYVLEFQTDENKIIFIDERDDIPQEVFEQIIKKKEQGE